MGKAHVNAQSLKVRYNVLAGRRSLPGRRRPAMNGGSPLNARSAAAMTPTGSLWSEAQFTIGLDVDVVVAPIDSASLAIARVGAVRVEQEVVAVAAE